MSLEARARGNAYRTRRTRVRRALHRSVVTFRHHHCEHTSPSETMRILPREQEKVFLHQVGFLAQKRLARGVRLNQAEATALIASVSVEGMLNHNLCCTALWNHAR